MNKETKQIFLKHFVIKKQNGSIWMAAAAAL